MSPQYQNILRQVTAVCLTATWKAGGMPRYLGFTPADGATPARFYVMDSAGLLPDGAEMVDAQRLPGHLKRAPFAAWLDARLRRLPILTMGGAS